MGNLVSDRVDRCNDLLKKFQRKCINQESMLPFMEVRESRFGKEFIMTYKTLTKKQAKKLLYPEDKMIVIKQ
jgi:hypothetical protein